MTTLEAPPDALSGIPAAYAEIEPPSVRYPGLFQAMCIAEVRADGIDIADIEAKFPDELVMTAWDAFLERNPEGYTKEQVKDLAEDLFEFPVREPVAEAQRRPGENILEYCKRIFLGSLRHATLNVGSQIGVDKPVLEPGGRFGFPKEGRGRLFNWDMWPTLRGAVAAMGKWGLERTQDTLANFEQLADKLNDCIPNVNTTWGAQRAQAPVVPRIVRLRAKHEGEQVLQEHLPLLERHFMFWRDGADKLEQAPGSQYRRVVRMPNGKIMYRHFDDGEGPRDEMYLADLQTLQKLEEALERPATDAEKRLLFKSLRASGESGEDFRTADSKNKKNLHYLHTIELAPIKLNAQMYEYASLLAYSYFQEAKQATDPQTKEAALQKARFFEQEAQDLADCIHEYCLTDDDFCADYDFVTGKTEPGKALAGIFGLSAGVFSQQRGERMLDVVDERFMRDGGLINTLYDSDEQWDKNAWPIMQMDAIDAAILYGRFDLAFKWAKHWINCNDIMFARYQALYEKSDPNNPGEPGNQGEYECVRDLLMTLGVDMALRDMLPWLQEMATNMQQQPTNIQAVGHLATAAT